MQKVEEEGEIVMVKEHRELDRTGTRKGHIVIKVSVKNPINLCFFKLRFLKRSPLDNGLISHSIYDLSKRFPSVPLSSDAIVSRLVNKT